MRIRHNTRSTELPPGQKAGAAQWDEEHEVLDPLSPLPGQYYNAGVTAGLNGASTLVANRIYLMPIRVRRPTPVDRLGILITTGVAAATVRVALYDQIEENGVNGQAGWPGLPLDQSTDMSAATTNELAQFTVARTFLPTLQYWAGVWASAAIGVRALPASNTPMIISNTGAALTGIGAFWRNLTYAGNPWPSPWGAVVPQQLFDAQNQGAPAVVWRAA